MHATNLIDTLTAAGVTVPDTFAAAARRYDQAKHHLATFDKAQTNADALAAELLNPDSPHDMRDLLTRAALPTALGTGGANAPGALLRREVAARLDRMWAATLTQHRPDLLDQLQPMWRAAGVALVELVDQFPAGDAADIIAAGDAAVNAWRQHPAAVRQVEQIDHAASALNIGVHVDNGNGWVPPRPLAGHNKDVPAALTLLDVPPPAWPDLREQFVNGWAAVALAILRAQLGEQVWTLTDPDGAQQRHQRIAAHEAAQQRQLDAEAARLSREAWAQSPEGKRQLALAEHHSQRAA